MTKPEDIDTTAEERDYLEWREELLSDPETRAIYAEEAAKKELWLQLVEARQAAGFTQAEVARRLGVSQAQVARIEKRGYDAHSVSSLRRYVQALGEGFSLEIIVHCPEPARRGAPQDVSPALTP